MEHRPGQCEDGGVWPFLLAVIMAAVLLADLLRHLLSRLASCGGSGKEAGCTTPQQQAAIGLLCETLINGLAAKASLNTAATLA